MALEAVERVRKLILPILERSDVQLYDVEHSSGVLRISVDRPGGIDVDTIGDLSTEISSALDTNDPLPDSRYLLEVSSPGIERKLRTPEHFISQVGSEINVKLRSELAGSRRLEVRLEAADQDGIDVVVQTAEGPQNHRLDYGAIESARVVFHWGAEKPQSKPKPAAKTSSSTPTKKKASAR